MYNVTTVVKQCKYLWVDKYINEFQSDLDKIEKLYCKTTDKETFLTLFKDHIKNPNESYFDFYVKSHTKQKYMRELISTMIYHTNEQMYKP